MVIWKWLESFTGSTLYGSGLLEVRTLVAIALVHEALRRQDFLFLGRWLTELLYTVFFFLMVCTKCSVLWFMFLILFNTKLYIPYTVNKFNNLYFCLTFINFIFQKRQIICAHFQISMKAPCDGEDFMKLSWACL